MPPSQSNNSSPFVPPEKTPQIPCTQPCVKGKVKSRDYWWSNLLHEPNKLSTPVKWSSKDISYNNNNNNKNGAHASSCHFFGIILVLYHCSQTGYL